VAPPNPPPGTTDSRSEPSSPDEDAAKTSIDVPGPVPAPPKPVPAPPKPVPAPPRPAKALTIRVPKLRLPRPSLPVTLVEVEEKPPRVRREPGRGFGGLTVLPAIIVAGWLVTGLPLLLAGVFAPVPTLLIAAPLITALAVNLLYRVPRRWPIDLPGQARERSWHSAFGIVGTVAVSAGFTAWQLVMRSPSIFAVRRPGAAFQTGYWLAQHGSLPIPGSLSAFGGPHPGLNLSSIGFVEHGHAIVPAVTAGLPMLLAGGFWTSGTSGGTVIAPILGGLAVLSFGGLVGRLAGRQWAPAGALALAVTLPEIYVSRDAFSETAVQILLFGGLSMVIDAISVRGSAREETAPAPAEEAGSPSARETASPWAGETVPPWAGETEPLSAGEAEPLSAGETMPMPAIGLSAAPAARAQRLFARARALRWRELMPRAVLALTPETMLAGLGGLALGLTSVLSLASLAYLVPAIAVAGMLLVARRSAGVAFCIGVLVGTGYGIAAGFVLARPPSGAVTRPLEVIGFDAGGVVFLMVAVLLALRVERVRRFVRTAVTWRPVRWLPGIGSLALILAIGWLAARPALQKVRGSLGSAQADYIAALQRMAGLRVDPARLYSEDTLYWVIWYAGIATVLLGAFGAAILIRRCLRTLLNWEDSSGTGLNWALPLAVILGGAGAVLWQPFTVPDQPWASRRLVPVVLPGLILLATWAAAWLTRRASHRGAGAVTIGVVAIFCLGAMVVPSISTAFGFGLTHAGSRGGLHATAGGLAQHRVGAHEANAVRTLCAALGRSSSVVVVDRRVAEVFSQVIRGMCGVPVAWVPAGAPPAVTDAVLAGIAKAGRHAVMLGSRADQLRPYGGTANLILKLSTTQYPHELTQPPGAPWRARYTIWMASFGPQGAGV
jgi:hypothetical protein